VSERRHKDVEELIFRGFLSTKVQLGDVYLVVKSLNPRELDAIRERTPLKSSPEYEEIFEALILAYALYLLEGENVIAGRPGNLSELVAEMREVPQNLRAELMGEVLVLQKAQDFALMRLEAFSYEASSRSMWGSYKGRSINDPMLTGIAGTQSLGLNSHQIAWAYLNGEEDNRTEAEMLWGFAKFVASAANSKGVKKIETRDAARLKRLMEERERVRLGQEYEGPQRIERRTVVDLRAQLESDITGKQDLHDKIISQYETSLRKRREQREAQMAAIRMESIDAARTEREDLTDEELAAQIANGDGFVKVFTKDQVDDMRKRQAQESLDFSRRAREGRYERAKAYKQDRDEIAGELQELAALEERMAAREDGRPPDRLDLATGPQGPTGRQPAPEVSRRPARNTRIPTPGNQPPTPPQAARGPDTAPTQRGRGKQTGWKELPNGDRVPVYANAGGVSQKGGDISHGGPSKRLTRHNYGPEQQREQGRRVQGKRVSVRKTGTTYTEVPGEDDFFAGSETSFTNKKAKK